MGWALVLLFARIPLALGFQALIAWSVGWDRAAAWWPASSMLANFATLGLLLWRHHREGTPIFEADRAWRENVALSAGTFVVAVLLTAGPTAVLASTLWGSRGAPLPILYPTLPPWAVWSLMVLFPLSIAVAELPTYYGYVLPHVERFSNLRWLPILFVTGMHAAQGIVSPPVCDVRFVLWRVLMFWPWLLFVAWALDRRPGLLPYVTVLHGFVKVAVPVLVLAV